MVVSQIEMEGVRKKDYFGLRMYDLTPEIKPTVKCTFALSPTEKATMEGKLSFDRHEGSHTYPEEVVVSLWTTEKPVITERAFNGGYYRVEIVAPRRVFTKMCEKALQKLWLLEE